MTIPASALPIRPELAAEQPYGAPQLQVPVTLNVNENPYAPPPEVLEAITAAIARVASGLNRYPDRDFRELRTDLATYLATESAAGFLTADNIWAANGSNEVMLHLMQAFGGPGRTAISYAPTYSMYPEYARDTSTGWIAGQRTADYGIDVDAALEAIDRHRPSLVILANPNNPTGTTVGAEVIEAICRATWDGARASAVVVVDEAYAEFRRAGVRSALDLLPSFPHLAVTRTMSKAFAMAGARIGYLAGAPELVNALRVVRLPYHLSALTQAAARAALAHAPALQAQVERLRTERDHLQDWLGPLLAPLGAAPVPSDANFILFGPLPDATFVWQRLLDQGVLIRQVGPAGFLRVSVGTPEENQAFRTALSHILTEEIHHG